ncbi:unnamed protein product [Mytilus coruscus]|uniref:Uncharacterized protein n=1 Tax=Mytilus coruscus TaxID=42192 RepID=A0A6J8F1F3_MYTCO|nr:unnamed protein product [Mytilus coruscus]
MELSQTDTSTVLTESRDVLYGETSQDITLQSVYQLLINMNGRLTSIEKGMTQVTQMNRTLTTLAKDFIELKTKVNEVESKVQKLNVSLDKQLKNLHVNNKEVNNNLQSISDFMDDFKVKHDNNVKDVKQIRSSVSRVANHLDDQTTELRSCKVLSNTYRLKSKSFGVNQQFPDEIEQARKSLYPLMKKKRAEGCQVKLVRDILYVDGEIYNEQRYVEDELVTNTQTHTKMSHTPDKNPVQKRKRTTTPKHG